MSPYIGCAGWSIPKAFNAEFPGDGTHLQRYAARFNAVEINSSFYRPHRQITYARWADSTPPEFRFAVKMPKVITHTNGLEGCSEHVGRFLLEVGGLGSKLGAILVQLPSRLKWNFPIANAFFTYLRGRVATPIVCEPRHISWFSSNVDHFFEVHAISRVLADPPIKKMDDRKTPISDTCYFRLHGHPRIYYSSYDDNFLANVADQIANMTRDGKNVWCIFDNTALGAATENALKLQDRISIFRKPATASTESKGR
jgi:uncharacterized protein YecE (DUF72 family)